MSIGKFTGELTAAGLTGALGLAAVIGSAELGASWTESGPEPGYFPFYVGLILLAASIGNALMAWRNRAADVDDGAEPLLNAEQARRLAGFALPLVAYVVLAVWVGLYVSSAIYVAYNAWHRGGYRPLVSLAIGIGFALGLYLVFDYAFQVPLLKGPLEELLGIY